LCKRSDRVLINSSQKDEKLEKVIRQQIPVKDEAGRVLSLGATIINLVVFYLFGGFCAYLRDDEGYKIPGWLFGILLF
ncbi:20345_t:CDS:2, partial [Gigaspora margarita]